MKNQMTYHSASPEEGRGALLLLLGGILGMVIAMGIGRFAFTPILPLMQRDLGMSNTAAGWLAGLNYLGYLVGAILCSILPQLVRFRSLPLSFLFMSVVTTWGMGWTTSIFWWGGLRFSSGVISAILFIIISSEVGEALVRRGYGHWVGAIYAGVGTGIALSGLSVSWLDKLGQWDGAWTGMGVMAAVLSLFCIALTKNKLGVMGVVKQQKSSINELTCLWPLAVAYFFEGLGYIVTATFIVAIVAATPGLEIYAPYSWVAVGVAAVPSTILWPYLARRIGHRNALLSAFTLQAVGILVSIDADSIGEVLFAAISFGGTFLGIVTLTLSEGSLRMKHEGHRAAAILTASFSVGQILGPILAGFISDMQGGFSLSLLSASICVVIGSVFIVTDRHYVQR